MQPAFSQASMSSIFEVAAIGDDVDRLDAQDLAGRFCGLRQEAHVDDLVGHRLLDDQLVLRVDGDLDVVANADLGMRGHGAAVGIGQRDLSLVGPLKLRQHRLISAALLAERCDLLGEILGARPTICRPVFDVAMVEPFEVFVQPLVGCTDERAQRRAGEVAVLVVDRLDAGSVDRQQLAAVEVEPPAQQHELAEHRFEGAAVGASEVRDRLEVRLEAAHQPDDLDIALGFPLQPSARSNPVQIAVDVELQEIAGRVARPPRRLRFNSREAGARKIEPINEGLDEPNRIVDLDVIVNRLRQQQKLVPSESGDVGHARF